ncbi:FAD-binding protein [Corynebacterium sanguinis]|uniref:FAD-binding protein n=2 Tax=Corynebacteriaceae TaxID=1653 RepID=A0A6C1TWZ3_9CORY|nr:FAD-binding protein [Corynebacterium sanguinis]TVS21644.1 FAD-binding protein [Corynebacterium sanguinis]TVS24594.1 FAD-binding protein [Corynebacterium sanguinis]TVS28108.1 FAD-binding protein [Corynebacterium sanguinis]
MDPAMSRTLKNGKFRNWAGSVTTHPDRVHYPATIDEVAAIVSSLPAGRSIRPVGGGHSFTPVAAGEQDMMSLDNLSGVVKVDRARKRVRFLAGTRLHHVPQLLAPFGLALANQGDIDTQSIAGAISTSTHGTGIGYTGFAGTVTALSLIDASGNLHSFAFDDDPDALRLVTVSLGALGIIVEVEMQCVDSFDLLAVEGAEDFTEVLDTWEERTRAVDHYEAFWFPHTDRAMVKSNTSLEPTAPAPDGEPRPRTWLTRAFEEEVIGNGVFAASLAFTRRVPAAIPRLNAISVAAMGATTYRSRAHEVFASPRRVRFHEMEFAVPLADGPGIVRELQREIDDRGWLIPFPFELRSTAADEVALSSSTGRESMYIAIHVPKAMNPANYFPRFEEILRAAGGRPHWGKMHTMGRADFSEIYPRFDEFCALREAMDPNWVFGSAHLRHLFG